MIYFLRLACFSRGTWFSGGSRKKHRCSSHSSTLVTMMMVIYLTRIWEIKREADSYAVGGSGIVNSGCHGWNFGRGGGGRRLFYYCWCCWSRNFCGGFVFLPKLGIFFRHLRHCICDNKVTPPPLQMSSLLWWHRIATTSILTLPPPSTTSSALLSPSWFIPFLSLSAWSLLPLPPLLIAAWIHPLLTLPSCAIPPLSLLQPSPQHIGWFDWRRQIQNPSNLSLLAPSPTSYALLLPSWELPLTSALVWVLTPIPLFLTASWAHPFPLLLYFSLPPLSPLFPRFLSSSLFVNKSV